METKTKPWIKYVTIGVWIVAFLVILLVIVIIVKQNHEKQEEAIYEEWLVDLASETEELNPDLLEIVKDDPNYKYKTSTTQSQFTEMPANSLSYNKDYSSLANSLASGVSVLTGKKAKPEDFVLNATEGDKYDFGAIPEKYNAEITEVEAMNANILNYYLDNDSVVVIYAKGGEPYDNEGRAILIIGGYLVDGVYAFFSPMEYGQSSDEEIALAPKTMIFEAMKSDVRFFVIKALENEV